MINVDVCLNILSFFFFCACSVAGDFSLAIENISLEDNAKFQCQVGPGKRGEPGIRSRFATITVLVPPERPEIVQGEKLLTTEDREIELECVSKGGKPAAEVKFFIHELFIPLRSLLRRFSLFTKYIKLLVSILQCRFDVRFAYFFSCL